MKRALAALAAAAFATSALALSNPYTTDAGESESDNVVKIQLGDAGKQIRDAERTTFEPQLG